MGSEWRLAWVFGAVVIGEISLDALWQNITLGRYRAGNGLGPIASCASKSRKVRTLLEYELSCSRFHEDKCTPFLLEALQGTDGGPRQSAEMSRCLMGRIQQFNTQLCRATVETRIAVDVRILLPAFDTTPERWTTVLSQVENGGHYEDPCLWSFRFQFRSASLLQVQERKSGRHDRSQSVDRADQILLRTVRRPRYCWKRKTPCARPGVSCTEATTKGRYHR